MAIKRRTREEWMALFEQQNASGLEQREWCEINGIKPNTMREMLRRIRQDAATNVVAPADKTGWVEVVGDSRTETRTEYSGNLCIEVGEYRLVVGSTYPVETLVTVLRGLRC